MPCLQSAKADGNESALISAEMYYGLEAFGVKNIMQRAVKLYDV